MANVYNKSGQIIGNVTDLVSPEAFGAYGDGLHDDTSAIQDAVNSSKGVIFDGEKTYKTTSPIMLSANAYLDLNGATINCTDKHVFYNFKDGDSYSGYGGNGNITICNGTIVGGCISFIHGEHIRLSNVRLQNTLNDHFMEICACKDYIVEGCSFIGMQNLSGAALEYINIDTNASYPAFPHNKAGQNDPVFYDGATNKDIIVRNCYFSVGADTFAYGFNAVGVHSRNVSGTYADGVTIENNIIRGFSLCGIRVNAMQNAYVADNDIRVVGDGIRIGDVADCIGVVVKGNYIEADSGNNIVPTSGQYTDLTVAYNVSKGMNDMN